MKIIFPQDFEGIFSVSFSIWCSAWEFQYNSNYFACTAPLPFFPLWKFLHSLFWMLVDICDDRYSIGLFIVWAFSGLSQSVEVCTAGKIFLIVSVITFPLTSSVLCFWNSHSSGLRIFWTYSVYSILHFSIILCFFTEVWWCVTLS